MTLFERPIDARAVVVLAHGAGAGMRHPYMTALAEALHAQGLATFRYEFPYMAKGGKRPDPPKVLTAAVVAAVDAAEEAANGLPLFAGGKSLGSRMTTTAASEGRLPTVKGLVCYGFPLHPAKQPGTIRAQHLGGVTLPTLFLQGTRDDLCDLELMREVMDALPSTMKMHVVEGADHGFAVLKSSGRTGPDVLKELALQTSSFVDHVLKG